MKSFCIIGMGRFGMTLAQTLAQSGKNVLIIDNDEKNVEAMADIVDTAILGDGSQEAVLRAADVESYDCAVVSMSQNISDSLMAVLLLKELGVQYVMARADSERHAKVLEKLGVDRIVFPEADYAINTAHALVHDRVQQYITFGDGAVIAETEVPAAWIGKSLLELDVRRRFRVNVVSVHSEAGNSSNVFVDPDTKFEHGDRIKIVGVEEAVNKLLSLPK